MSGDVEQPDPDPLARLLATHIARTAKKGAPQVEDLASAISEITAQTQTAGSSILTLSLIDPQWKLVTSGFLDVNEDGLIDEIDLEFPEGSGSWWRICMVQPDNGIDAPNLILTFEDRIVSYLRDKWGPKGVSPGTTTRAQFVKQLVDEVGRGDGLQPIKFVCPSLNVEQPVATDSSSASNTVVLTPPSKAASDARRANKRRGVGHGAAVTAKGQALDANQISEVNTLLDTADGLHAGQLATTALICAAIGESWIGREPGSFVPNSAGYWGVLQGASGTKGTPNYWPDPHDTAGMATSFLLGGKGFQGGGAIKLARKGNGVQDLSPGAIATMVEASGEPANFYGQYMREAWAIIQAYGGVSEGSQASDAAAAVPTPALSDVSQLTRGTADNPDESSWDCITRLASDVQWYAFSNADTLYYLDGTDLLAQRPAAYLKLVTGSQLDWQLTDSATGRKTLGAVMEIRGTVDNTAYVYRSTHRRKGKVVHKSRIARPQTPSEIQLNLICEPDYLRAGDVIVIQDAGTINGRWVITDATRNILADTHTQFTLAPPQAPTPEPQASSTATSATTSSPGGSSPGGPGSGATPAAKGAAKVSSYPLAVRGRLIGTPYQGTHAKAFNVAGGSDNWESENAVDIGVRTGTAVFAVDDGTIGPEFGSLTSGGRFAGLRLHLVTSDNEWYYAHLTSFATTIRPGSRVRAGQVLGYSGEANGVAHLHLACERGNPVNLLGLIGDALSNDPTNVRDH